jgi:hypothetical protein
LINDFCDDSVLHGFAIPGEELEETSGDSGDL